jgi:methylase of polypeptide subunit release factors
VVTNEDALTELLRTLKAADYRFVAVTPATHALVVARPLSSPPTLRDIFGWSRMFGEADVDPELMALMRAANALDRHGGQLKCRLRVASLGGDLFLHSAFPTVATNSVFFGPDTYRFARFVEQQLPGLGDARWLVDMGSGSGAGAIAAARVREFARITMVDVNPAALALATINAQVAGVEAELAQSDAIPSGPDVVIANPPYIIDSTGRSYRDGGALLGGAVAIQWVEQAIANMAPGGSMILYTGAAFADGQAPFLSALEEKCSAVRADLDYVELDPDVFGEELAEPPYANVERIAAIGAVIQR